METRVETRRRFLYLIRQGYFLFTLDLVKEKMSSAYSMNDESKMADAVIDIIDICKATNNKHLLWFGRLLDTHFEGIIAHATYKISNTTLQIWRVVQL